MRGKLLRSLLAAAVLAAMGLPQMVSAQGRETEVKLPPRLESAISESHEALRKILNGDPSGYAALFADRDDITSRNHAIPDTNRRPFSLVFPEDRQGWIFVPCDRRINSGQLRLILLFERRIVPQHIIQRGKEGRNDAGPIRPFLVISAQALKSEGYRHADENDGNLKNEFPDPCAAAGKCRQYSLAH